MEMVRDFFNLENMMTSVERVMTYTQLEPEPGYDLPDKSPDTWPTDAAFEIKDLNLVYYPNGPSVLKNLIFTLRSHEKLGIAGRTGAGKSTIVAALMRMPEPAGQILIDGIDVQSLNLSSYRSRVSVIAQDPVLFSGPLRENLDPTSRFSDVELWTALQMVHLNKLVESLDGQLYHELTEGGDNFSAGQKQLLCLARALLQGNKIIVLDEATANVDYSTDELIQHTIRNEFKHCTVLTIAHRVSTILDCDRVMLLQEGRIVEFDRPQNLLKRGDGEFSKLYGYHQAVWRRLAVMNEIVRVPAVVHNSLHCLYSYYPLKFSVRPADEQA